MASGSDVTPKENPGSEQLPVQVGTRGPSSEDAAQGPRAADG